MRSENAPSAVARLRGAGLVGANLSGANLMEADLTGAGIPTLSLTGQTRDRAEVLEAFARGDASVFLLSLKAGGRT